MALLYKMFFSVFLLATTLRGTTSLPSGAPSRACGKWYPLHAGTKSKASANNPYSFKANRRYFDLKEAGADNITVTLDAPTDIAPFKGFVIAAYDSKAQPFGQFLIDGGIQAKNVQDCAESAITHIDPRPKRKLSVVWVPPLHDTRTWDFIQFRATIVRDYENFWVGVDAEAPPVA